MPPPFFDFFAAVDEGWSAMEMRVGDYSDRNEPQGICLSDVPTVTRDDKSLTQKVLVT